MRHQSRGSRLTTLWLVALFVTALTILAHIYSPSTWTLSDTQWDQTLSLHRDSPIFKVRSITTLLITFFHESLGVRVKLVFFSLQFLLYFLNGPVFYYYLRQIGSEHRFALAGMVLWQFSLPLFMAHFEPVFTWSDFWVYLFVPLSLACAVRGRMLLTALCMAVALIARETSLLFVPFIVFLSTSRGGNDKCRGLVAATIAVVLFVVVRIAFAAANSPSPDFKLGFNFADSGRVRDTLFSVFISLGFVWPLGLLAAFRNVTSEQRMRRVMSWGGLIVSVGLVGSTLLFGQARETRLFAPAAIFLIPLSLMYIEEHLHSIRSAVGRLVRGTWQQAVVAVLLVAISVAIGKVIVPQFEYRRWQDGNWLFLGLHIAATFVFVWYELWRRGDRRHGT